MEEHVRAVITTLATAELVQRVRASPLPAGVFAGAPAAASVGAALEALADIREKLALLAAVLASASFWAALRGRRAAEPPYRPQPKPAPRRCYCRRRFPNE
jgi:hypothetical protein